MPTSHQIMIPLPFGATQSEMPFNLPFAPFESGDWKLLLQQPFSADLEGGTVSLTLSWSGFKKLHKPFSPVICRFDASASDWTSTTQLKYELKSVEPGSSSFGVSWLAQPYVGGYVSLHIGKSIDEKSSKLVQAVQPLLIAGHPHDVRIYFPREDRELWGSSSMLKKASPYFKALLGAESGFTESQVTFGLNFDERKSVELPFDDSDDEEEEKRDALSAAQERTKCNHPHHTITISQTAFKTYKAVLLWIATGHVSFARCPAGATIVPDSQDLSAFPPLSSKHSDTLPQQLLPAPASPKSVYRLAHLLELAPLQKLALDNIKSQLNVATVGYQLFSDMAPIYPEFRTLVVKYVVAHWSEVKESEAFKEMSREAEMAEWGSMVGVLLQLALQLR